MLPGGGSFELALPDEGGTFVEEQGPVVPFGASDAWSPAVPVLAGALLGGVLTWLFLRLSRQ